MAKIVPELNYLLAEVENATGKGFRRPLISRLCPSWSNTSLAN